LEKTQATGDPGDRESHLYGGLLADRADLSWWMARFRAKILAPGYKPVGRGTRRKAREMPLFPYEEFTE